MKLKPTLYVSADLGSSKSKITASLAESLSIEQRLAGEEQENLRCIEMDPAVIEIAAQQADRYRELGDFGEDLKNLAFISSGGNYYAVGKLAELDFSATAALSERKIANAPQRLMAAIWVAAEKLGVGKSFDLHLKCLLPPVEYADKGKLEILLTESLRGFDTPTGVHKVSLKKFTCSPEGYGMTRGHVALRKKLRAPIGDRVLGVVTLGHRDCSVFRLAGKIGSPSGNKLGFSWMLDRIYSAVSSNYPKEKMTRSIAPYLLTGDDKYLQELEPGKDYREALREVIGIEKTTYLKALFLWLSQDLKNIDDVIIGGGTAQLFAKEITGYFCDRLPSYPGDGGKAIFMNGRLELPKNSVVPEELRARFIDVYFL